MLLLRVVWLTFSLSLFMLEKSIYIFYWLSYWIWGELVRGCDRILCYFVLYVVLEIKILIFFYLRIKIGSNLWLW